MGGVYSVFIAQQIAKFLQQQVGEGETYIDNFIFTGDLRVRVTNIAEKYNTTLSQIEWGNEVEYIGLKLNTTNQTIGLSEKFRKHFDFLQTIGGGVFSHLQLWKLFGVIWRFIEVSSRPVVDLYHTLRLLKKTARLLSKNEELWETEAFFPPEARNELLAVAKECMEMKQYAILDTPELNVDETPILFTDASLTGLGYVYIKNRKATVGSLQLPGRSSIPIHILESLAVEFALHRLCIQGRHQLLILNDNQIVTNSIRKGVSPIPCINRMIGKLVQRPASTWVAWIPSETNLADEPSRGKPLRHHTDIPRIEPFRLRQWSSYAARVVKTSEGD